MKYNLKKDSSFKAKRFLPARRVTSRPAAVDLRSKLPPCFDQGEEGSCGPNSASALMCFFHPDVPAFSRQQIYYNVREIEGTTASDDGVITVDLFKVLEKTGAAPESLWPYVPSDFKTAPPENVINAASAYKIKTYSQLVSEDDFLSCLAEGFPFILGFEVYELFEGIGIQETGVMTIPQSGNLLGGHDVLVVGYDTNFFKNPDFVKSRFTEDEVEETMLLVRNSWGTDWGTKNGHFWMPISYAVNALTGGDAYTART